MGATMRHAHTGTLPMLHYAAGIYEYVIQMSSSRTVGIVSDSMYDRYYI